MQVETRSPTLALVRLLSTACFLAMALPAGKLLGHTSQEAAAFMRYSLGYLTFLAAYFGLAALLLGASLYPSWGWNKIYRGIHNALSERRRSFLWWGGLLLTLAGLAAILALAGRFTPGREPLVRLALVAFALWFIITTGMLLASRRAFAPLGPLVLLVLSIGFSMGLVEVFLRFQPRLIPTPVRLSLPGSGRYLHASDFTLDVPVRIGYRFAPMQDRLLITDPYDPGILGAEGIVGPYGETISEPLRLHFVTDENGFLNRPPVTGNQYPIVILGDSFLGLSAPENWVELVAQNTGQQTLSLGISGWGTQAEVEALKQFGLDKQPEWVVLAYFEGNDLWDVARYEEHRDSGVSWIDYDVQVAGFWDRLVTPRMLAFGAKKLTQGISPPDYIYPLDLAVNGHTIRVAFEAEYMGMLTASAEDIRHSRNLELVQASLREAQKLSQSAGARFLMVYIPVEAHIYMPTISDPGILARTLQGAPAITVNEQGYLQKALLPLAPADLLAHYDDQASVIAEFARQNGIDFLDLTPHFQAQVQQGVDLYNYADTHWNVAGHRLAAQVVADYIRGK